MFATCGDSFACIDKRESEELQWPVYVANNLGYTSSQQLHLGRGASDNWYIYLQAKWALENHSLDCLVVWWTTVHRFLIRHPDSEEDESLIGANEVGTNLNRHEINYAYENYSPQYISDTYNNVITDSRLRSGSRKRHKLLEEDWIVLQQYWEKFHSVKKAHLELQTMRYAMENLCREYGVEYFNFPDPYLAGQMMRTREFGDTLILANHFGINGHKTIGDYIWKTIERKSNIKKNNKNS